MGYVDCPVAVIGHGHGLGGSMAAILSVARGSEFVLVMNMARHTTGDHRKHVSAELARCSECHERSTKSS
jgi:cytochrome c553